MDFDVIVIGAGMVGASIAFGLSKRGRKVLALDGGDGDFRAARGNGGLVWVQSKGLRLPAYRDLTERSARAWRGFADELEDLTGVDVGLRQPGGLALCLGEAEFEARRKRLTTTVGHAKPPRFEMLNRAEVQKILKGVTLGPELVGASFGEEDGTVNPLQLLLALQMAVPRAGGKLVTQCPALSVTPRDGGFAVETPQGTYRADKVVIAAGVQTAKLAAQVGLDVPVRPQRGQTFVTERTAPFLTMPMLGTRQSAEGSVFTGTTKEDAGFDTSVSGATGVAMAKRSVRLFPQLASLRVVRQWACLRIMTPDGSPVYAESETHPGAFVTVCHSGLTLAPAHATEIAELIDRGPLNDTLAPFHQRRFDVQDAS